MNPVMLLDTSRLVRRHTSVNRLTDVRHRRNFDRQIRMTVTEMMSIFEPNDLEANSSGDPRTNGLTVGFGRPSAEHVRLIVELTLASIFVKSLAKRGGTKLHHRSATLGELLR